MFAFPHRLVAAAFVCAAQTSFAQSATSPIVLRGRITDAVSGQAVAKASVQLVGTTFSAVTDADGQYEISNAPSGVFTVVARRVGVGTSARDNVRLGGGGASTGVTTLNFAISGSRAADGVETAASPFGRSTRMTPFGVDELSAENMPIASVASPAAMLAGKVAGVTVIQASGAPGTSALIRLRNARAINDSTPPLYVVDGVMLSPWMPMTDQDIESLDIENVEVLKGVAASAYYGARGGAGVIAITTKRGRALPLGALQFSVRNEARRDNSIDFFDSPLAHDFLVNAAGQYVNTAGVVVPRSQRVEQPNRIAEHLFIDPTFDHGDQFFRTGGFNTQTVNVQQNRASNNFNLSYSRADQNGTVPNVNGFQRQTVRANFDQRWRDKVEISLSASRGVSNEDPALTDFQTMSTLWADVNLRAPDPTGVFPYIYDLPKSSLSGVASNPLSVRLLFNDRVHRQRTLASLNLAYHPISWLSLDVRGSYDRGFRSDHSVTSTTNTPVAAGLGSQNNTTVSDTTQLGMLQGGVTATRTFGALTTRLSARGERQRETQDKRSASSFAIPSGSLDTLLSQASSTSSQFRVLEGRFANLNLDYRGRYVADMLFRRDENGERDSHGPHANSYRAAIAWLLSEESWFPFDRERLFKVRYSAASIESDPNIDLLDFPITTQITQPSLPRSVENEIGVDMDVTSRMQFSLAYATAKTTSSSEQLTPALGYYPQPATLMGSSVEATINWRVLADAKGLRWDMSLTGDHRKNTVVKIVNGPCRTYLPLFICEGQPITSMYESHLIRSKARLAQLYGSADTTAFDINDEGYVVYVGAGNSWRDGKAKNLWGTAGQGFGWGLPIDDLSTQGGERSQMIDVNPDLRYGIQNSIRFKGFAFYTQFAGQVGGKTYNEAKRIRYRLAADPVLDQSQKPDDARKPRAYYFAVAAPLNDFFYENATNIRLAEASIGYTFDVNRFGILKHIGAKQVEIDVVGRNLFTLSGYSGLNVQGNSLNASIEQFDYPLTRTFTLATSIKF